MRRIILLLTCGLMAAVQASAQAPNISYPSGSYSFPVGTAISPLTPTNTGSVSVVVVTTLAGGGNYTFADGMGTVASFAGPRGVAVDGSGYVYVADQYNSRIRKISPAGVVSTLAGSGNQAFADGTGTAASFASPHGVAVDGSGNVYVADAGNHRIRKISPAGVVTTLAGGGGAGWNGRGYADGTGTAASFSSPTGVAVDGSGNVYVADADNYCIRKISPAGVVTTLAGGGNYANGTGTAASFNYPTGVAVDGSGNVYVAEFYNHRIRKISPAGVVTTLAGGGGNYADGTGTAASFYYPTGVAVDGSGNVYVADQYNHRIRKISPAGAVTTLAGSGNGAYADGTGTAASFSYPTGVAVDGSGNVYVADGGNHRIRKISPAGVVTTFAGSGCTQVINGTVYGCYADGTGTAASFAYPGGVAVDGSGNVYVADGGNHRIRKISPAGAVTTLAGSGNGAYADGTGTAASFNGPTGVAVDGSGNVYVADCYNHRIRKISSAGVVTTLAGSGYGAYDDGTGTAASFFYPFGVTVDGSGNVYVADENNHRIRKISPAGVVTTLAGSGCGGYGCGGYADGTGTSASFYSPTGVAVDGSGNVYVADQYNHRIRKISQSAGGYTVSPALPAGLSLNATTGEISGTPTISTPATAYTITATNASGSSSFTITIATTDSAAPSLSLPGLNPTTNFCPGSTVAVNFTATGFNPGNVFTVQLSSATGSFANPKNIGTLTSTSGGTINAVIPPTQSAGTKYRIRIVTSDPVITGPNNGINLTVLPRPAASAVAIAPSGTQNICVGSGITLSAVANATNQYQWMLAGSPIAGATTNSYTTGAAGIYAVTITGANGCSRTSGNRKVTVNPMPLATFTVTNATGGSKKLYALQGSAQYQWYLDGNSINGATARTYLATTSGNYHVVVTRKGCTTSGNPIAVTTGSSPRRIEEETVQAATANVLLNVYPNPASGSATILIQGEQPNTWQVRVLDVAGRVVEQLKADQNVQATFGVHLAPGIYTIEATNGANRLVQQWVKQ